MKKSLFTLIAAIITSTSGLAQTIQTIEKVPKTEVDSKEIEKTEKDNICLLTDMDELNSLANGKITHPKSIPRVKREISKLTSCAIDNIRIISGRDTRNTAEYTACVCGTKMIFKADYFTKIKTVFEL